MNIREIFPGLFQIMLSIPRGGFESFINAWLVIDKARSRTLLFETGPAAAVPQLAEDLKSLAVSNIDYLLYTHIHLDHSGGAGQFHKIFPRTLIIAPPKGRSHLVNPEKLLQASRSNIGDLCDVYGAPEPLPVSVLAASDFELDGLEIIDTPGHAPHHNSYVYDLAGTRILFAGEAAGCYFELPDGRTFMRPATPHKFYYDTAIESIDKLIALDCIDIVCYPHSGFSRKSTHLLIEARTQMQLWHDVVKSLPAAAGTSDAVDALMKADPVLKLIESLPAPDRRREEFFLRQSADGYLGYFERERSADQRQK